ncbi:syndecan-1 [Mantella aurantiaca]
MDLLALLFLLGICGSLTSGNDVKPAPPEDLDGSGDDEDFSGSGLDSKFREIDTKDEDVFSTPVSPLVTQVSTAQNPDVAVEEETEEENVTQQTQTTKPHDPIEDIFAIDPVEKETFAEEGTTLEPTTHQPSIVESVNDVKKHHHHTTMPVTSLPANSDLLEETASFTEVEKPFVPEETTTSTPDEGDVDDFVQETTPTHEEPVQHVNHPEDSVQHVDYPETTSGLTSTPYAENEETTTYLAGIDEIPVFMEKTTVADEAHTHKPHHHHPHHSTTTTPLDGSDILIETTENSDYLEPEGGQDHQGEANTTPSSEDKHHHKHHHTTTPEATESTVPEQFIVHTLEPKGRKINIPHAETTTAIQVLSEDDEPVDSTVQYNYSVSPTLDEDNPDSSEGESGDGPLETDDIFFEKATVPINKSDRMAPVPGDGSADASHGIMERKEILAGIVAGGLAGLLFAASLVAFVFYRMKKKDEGSYSLEEPKQSNGGYQKPREQREFYA